MSSIVGYCRVSSREQSDNSSALEQQIARVREAGAEDVLIDVESGRSSREDDRTEFQKLMKLVEQQRLEKVIVTRLDRLSRSLPTLRRIVDTFQESEVVLIALDNAVDMSTAAGKFHLNMLGALAEMESDHLSERIRHGHAHFRKQKKACHAPFGYLVKGFKLLIDRTKFICLIETQAEFSKADLSRWLIDTYISVQSLGGTVRKFNEVYGFPVFYSSSAFRRWIMSPILRGHLVYHPKSTNPEIHHNEHEPIMTESEHQDIKQIMEFNSKVGGFGYSRGRYALTGLVKCDCCGKGCIVANGAGGKYKYFLCARSRTKACECFKGVRMEVLEKAVIEALVKRSQEIADLASTKTPQKESAELAELRSQLAVLEAMGSNPAIVNARESLKQQIESLTHRRELGTQVDTRLQNLLMAVAGQADFWEGLPIDQKRRFLRALVEAVVIRNGVLVGVDLLV
ncbi:MAG: recombinase family protein [Leptolyngbya sp. SIOISBB]|nr:recombinase family protein [Leptolyngbya sp. SIOISBB]